VTFVAAPGETNELRMVPHPEGVRIVDAGAGRDQIYAGSGDDLVHAAEPGRDTVRCGRGDDRAAISARDRVFGCERVVRRMHR
jgi:hypothetical protein